MSEITIRVKTLDGQTNEVTLLATSTVLQLKEIIEQKTEMPKHRQKIIYRGRILQDTMILKDQANLDGSAVHVVDSTSRVQPTQSDNYQAGSTGRPGTPSHLRGRGRERYRTTARAAMRENSVRGRVYSMEGWLNRFEASLTALDRRSSPEESRQFVAESDQDRRSNSENGNQNRPLLVTELAGFVARLADGIERFPAALRRLESFMRTDPLLESRTSPEFSDARSLVQNAMDATRYISQITQMFSQLIVPLGEVPPRNLNVINNHAGGFRIPPNFFVSPFRENPIAGFNQSLIGPLMAFEGSVSSPQGVDQNGTNADTASITSPPQLIITEQVPAPSRSQFLAQIHDRRQEFSATEPSNPSSSPVTANINVTANITPNVTIHIMPPGSSTQTNLPSRSTTATIADTSTNSRNVGPMLQPEILREITRSVNRLHNRNDPVVIEAEGHPSQDVGRIVGEAVFQTLQNIYTDDARSPRQSTNGQSQSQSQTTQLNADLNSTSNPRQPNRPERRDSPDMKITVDENQPLIKYLFGPNPPLNPFGVDGTWWESLFTRVPGLKDLTVSETLQLFRDPSRAKEEFHDLLNVIKSDPDLTAALQAFIEGLFENESPIPEANILESNLSLLRRFVFEINVDKPPIELVAALPRFLRRWIALNCEILRNGSTAMFRCLRSNFNLGCEFDKHLVQLVCYAIRSSDCIDGYVLSEKPATINLSPERSLTGSQPLPQKRESSDQVDETSSKKSRLK